MLKKLFLLFSLISCMPMQSEPYFGQWEIIDILFYSEIYALSPEEETKLMGSHLLLQANMVRWEEVECLNPVFKPMFFKIHDFNSPEMQNVFPPETEELEVVTIYEVKNDMLVMWDAPFRSLIVLDKDTLLLSSGGVYFKAVRIPSFKWQQATSGPEDQGFFPASFRSGPGRCACTYGFECGQAGQGSPGQGLYAGK